MNKNQLVSYIMSCEDTDYCIGSVKDNNRISVSSTEVTKYSKSYLMNNNLISFENQSILDGI